MTLRDPLMLLLLVPALGLLVWALRRRRSTVDGGSERVLADLPRTLRQRLLYSPELVLALVLILIVVALARPQSGREESRVVTEGIDIQLVLDTSSSMLEEGLERGLTNLDVVKEVVAQFVAGREDDRVGIISFAAYPKTECPLTLDMGAVQEHLGEIRCVRPNGPEDGTAIGVALGHAARKLMDSDAASRVIVLLTDGEENKYYVDPAEAAALCKDEGIRVYTIGAGTKVRRDEFFNTAYEVPLRTGLLEMIAEETNGRFYRAKDASILADVYEDIDALEKTEREDVRYTDYDDLYPWLLAPAAALLVLELLLRRGPYLELAG